MEKQEDNTLKPDSSSKNDVIIDILDWAIERNEIELSRTGDHDRKAAWLRSKLDDQRDDLNERKKIKRRADLAPMNVNNSSSAYENIKIPDRILIALENEKLITMNPFHWNNGKNSLCAYFVDLYFSKDYPNNFWKIGEYFFKVRNLRQAKHNYLGNKKTDGKPTNFQVIDSILR